ncbi:MAG: hypothetical protein ACK5LX_11260 [Oscillospiraceae bacterium]
MPDYKEMYLKLFVACSDIIEILQKVTMETEELAMDAPDVVSLAVKEQEPPESSPETNSENR